MNYTTMIPISLWCCHGRNDGEKGLGRCRWSYDGVEGSVVVEGPKMVPCKVFMMVARVL